ncbi:MAG: Holliday junction ATP-dependent DNA helicase RuvA [Candidatus Zixiibacteriota bacterium]
MISHLRGTVVKRRRDGMVVEAGGVGYDVLLPGAVAVQFEDVRPGDEVTFVISYHQVVTPSRITPLLVGFANDVEREFFEHFISVSGIGPKAACRALTLPFARVAQAIIEEDVAALTLMPGVGRKRAEEIIHQLKDKVAAAALCRGPGVEAGPPGVAEVLREAEVVLEQLGYGRNEIKEMLDALGDGTRDCETAEDVLARIYARQRGKA